MAFVVVEPFAVESFGELEKGDPEELDEGVQEGGIVEKIVGGQEHSGQSQEEEWEPDDTGQ